MYVFLFLKAAFSLMLYEFEYFKSRIMAIIMHLDWHCSSSAKRCIYSGIIRQFVINVRFIILVIIVEQIQRFAGRVQVNNNVNYARTAFNAIHYYPSL